MRNELNFIFRDPCCAVDISLSANEISVRASVKNSLHNENGSSTTARK